MRVRETYGLGLGSLPNVAVELGGRRLVELAGLFEAGGADRAVEEKEEGGVSKSWRSVKKNTKERE